MLARSSRAKIACSSDTLGTQGETDVGWEAHGAMAIPYSQKGKQLPCIATFLSGTNAEKIPHALNQYRLDSEKTQSLASSGMALGGLKPAMSRKNIILESWGQSPRESANEFSEAEILGKYDSDPVDGLRHVEEGLDLQNVICRKRSREGGEEKVEEDELEELGEVGVGDGRSSEMGLSTEVHQHNVSNPPDDIRDQQKMSYARQIPLTQSSSYGGVDLQSGLLDRRDPQGNIYDEHDQQHKSDVYDNYNTQNSVYSKCDMYGNYGAQSNVYDKHDPHNGMVYRCVKNTADPARDQQGVFDRHDLQNEPPLSTSPREEIMSLGVWSVNKAAGGNGVYFREYLGDINDIILKDLSNNAESHDLPNINGYWKQTEVFGSDRFALGIGTSDILDNRDQCLTPLDMSVTHNSAGYSGVKDAAGSLHQPWNLEQTSDCLSGSVKIFSSSSPSSSSHLRINGHQEKIGPESGSLRSDPEDGLTSRAVVDDGRRGDLIVMGGECEDIEDLSKTHYPHVNSWGSVEGDLASTSSSFMNLHTLSHHAWPPGSSLGCHITSTTPVPQKDVLFKEEDLVESIGRSTTLQSSLEESEMLDNNSCGGPAKDKKQVSYFTLISNAILNSPEKRLLLSEIYDYISQRAPNLHPKEKAWRNSIRHNLSLNECFIKQERRGRGRGHYWAIHPDCVEAFSRGDFRRRNARRQAKRASSRDGLSEGTALEAATHHLMAPRRVENFVQPQQQQQQQQHSFYPSSHFDDNNIRNEQWNYATGSYD